MNNFPIQFTDKVNSAEILAIMQQFGEHTYVDAELINKFRDALNELYFSSNPDRIISLGTETIDGNEHTYEDYTWQLGGVQVNNIGNPSVIVIPSSTIGFKRKDISVFTASGTIERVAGTETDGEVVTSPDVPEGTLYYKSYDIDGDTIGVDPEPPAIDGSIYKKKIENTRYKSRLSGENIIIPFQAAGQSHYSVTNAALVSVAGFTTAGLTTPMYEGQDVIFENQTGHEITLKNSFGVETSFVIGADLIVPNKGKIWFRFRNNELELIDKNWFDINEVATAQNLGEFINSLDSKTNVKDTDEFVLSDSDDGLKSKKTRFLDIKNKLKGYFDTLYLSLSIFNDFVTDVFSSLDNKLDKSTTPSSVYGTNTAGGQTMIPLTNFGTVKGTGTTNRISKFTASGTIGDSQIFDNGTNVGIGAESTSARLDIRAQGALSTDIAFRVRNSANTANLFNVNGLGVTTINAENENVQLRLTNTGAANNRSAIAFQFNNSGVDQAMVRALPGIIVGSYGRFAISTYNVFGGGMVDRMLFDEFGGVSIGASYAGNVAIPARLDIRAQGALSTDIAFRVRNSVDTANLLQVNGQGTLSLGLQSSAPTGIEGAIYYNSTDKKHYGFNGTTWNALY